MTISERRMRKAEERLGKIDSGIEEYRAALRKWFMGEIESVPDPPSSRDFSFAETTIMVLSELEKEAKLEGREFEPRFGSKGITVTESLAQEGFPPPKE